MADSVHPKHIILFFTRGASLGTWDRVGTLERETAIYRWLTEQGIEVTFVTYGDNREQEFTQRLTGIRVLYNRWNLRPGLYERLIPFLHSRYLSKADVFKSNQSNGADVALRAARFWQKRVIARCGYMWSELARHNGRYEEAQLAQRIESKVFRGAWKIVVTTDRMRQHILATYGAEPHKIQVVPNYVNTDLFLPGEKLSCGNRITYIGRLADEKNLLSLVEACADLPIDLVMVGEGSLREQLIDQAKMYRVNLQLLGRVENRLLPELYAASEIFVLVSYHEGHPKALLEAMSCGVPVIGADSPGIREIVRHRQNGLLCSTRPESIRTAILEMLSNPELRASLAHEARQYVVQNFAFERIAALELGIIQQTNMQGLDRA